MAKKNWRDAAPASPVTPVKSGKRAGWSGSASSSSGSSGGGRLGGAGKILFLLALAGVLGGLIAIYWRVIPPVITTPLLFCDAYPSSEGEMLLSTNAFSIETQKRLTEDTNINLSTTPGNLRTIADAQINVNQTDNRVAMFYLYADLFVADDHQAYLLSHDRRAGQTWDGNAIQPTANTELRKFLEEICRLDIGNSQRIVVLDCGRLDAAAFTGMAPEPIADAVDSVLTTLKDAKVPNVDQLWILLATDNFQLGWTSPELNGSVFGYFFSAGLRGQADRNDDLVISLAELNTFVQDTVARWVENYRDAVQTPRLLCGGDISNAETVNLGFHQSQPYETVSGFPNAQTLHDGLWQKAFSIPQPHRRQMAVTRLIRLEQLRYCRSKEYDQLVNQVKTILDESDMPSLLGKPEFTSVTQALSPQQLATATSRDSVSDFIEYLFPRKKSKKPLDPPATDPDETPDAPKGGASTQGTESSQGVAVDNSESVAGTTRGWVKKLGPSNVRLSSPQRLALVWQYVNRQPASGSKFKKLQLEESLNFIRRDDAANQECDHLVQMQLLDLLFKNLPWTKSDFNNDVLLTAIQSFEASHQLINGSLETTKKSRSSLPSSNQVWRDWRHLSPPFETLENRRRTALDRAIGEDIESATNEFKTLIEDYGLAREQLADLIDARETASELLFVVPYLKAFAVRNAAFRQDQDSEDFCLPLKNLAELEKTAGQIINQLNGSDFGKGEIVEIATLTQAVQKNSEAIRVELSRIASETSQSQSASKYVFDSIGMLSSPIPEWIDSQTNGETRKAILARLTQHLSNQQSQFFDKPDADERRNAKVMGTIASKHEQVVAEKLARFQNSFAELKPVSRDTVGALRSTNWNEVQTSIASLTPIEELKNTQPDHGPIALADLDSVEQELLRLRDIDQQLRLSGSVIGLSEKSSDTYQQQFRLEQFVAQFRLLRRSQGDFWGGGDVTKLGQRRPPFARQVHAHAANLNMLADNSKEFRLDGKRYSAYQAESLKRMSNRFVTASDDLWETFSRLRSQWEFNKTPLPILEDKLFLEESSSRSELGITLKDVQQTLAEPAFLPVGGTGGTPLTGQRIVLENIQYFEPFQIPDSIRNARTVGASVYRGHEFVNDLSISRKIVKRLPPKTLVFEPKFKSNDESLITVVNDIKNEVNLVFLIDCSGSMGGGLETVKDTTREIMLELASEKRFHIGLAAFGHRGEFTEERRDGQLVLINKRFPIKGNVHPFVDWELLAKVPKRNSDEQQINDLWDLSLSRLKPKGYTPLYYSIAQTLPYLANADRKNILVVVTDGLNSQYPDNFLNDPRAEPAPANGRRPRPTTFDDLNRIYQQKYAGQVNVLVMETKANINNRLPAGFSSVTLGQNTSEDMKAKVLDFVGRYKYSVTKQGASPGQADIKPMGETARLRVDRDSQYVVRTHGVPTGDSQQSIALSGGEDFRFLNTVAGLKLDAADAAQASERFLRPRVENTIELGKDRYLIGRLQSNQLDNVRIGFANKRGQSRYPDRIWARVRDPQGREFAMTHTSQEFALVPTFDFQMPSGFREDKIDMTVYVLPWGAAVKNGAQDAGDTGDAFVVITGEDAGEFRGLRYKVNQNEGSQTRFTATITAAGGPIKQDFHLECPNSVPIPESRAVLKRSVKYADVDRIEETFEFEVPENQSPTFRLYVQPEDKFTAAIADPPRPQESKRGVDPIFGDDVVIIEFSGVQIKN